MLICWLKKSRVYLINTPNSRQFSVRMSLDMIDAKCLVSFTVVLMKEMDVSHLKYIIWWKRLVLASCFRCKLDFVLDYCFNKKEERA